MSVRRPTIVILGGGFAGIAAARRLERLLRPDEARIVIASRENFTLFTPMVPEVSSGGLSARHIATPIRAQLRRAELYLGEVRSIDIAARTVHLQRVLDEGAQDALVYDHLVFALGAETSTFGLPGVAELAFPLKTLEDADRLRNHAIAMFELADACSDPAMQRRLLTFVFVGGGFTGVEAAGEMVDFFGSIARFYHNVSVEDIRIYLVEGGPKLLPDLPAGMGEYSARNLARRGVRVLLGAHVARAEEEAIVLADGRSLPTATIVWSAGVRPSALIADLPFARTRGGAILTNSDLGVPGFEGIWALGDCASIPAPGGGTYPPTAQHALREGPLVAENIVARLRGGMTKPFSYNALGMMASLGGRRGVAGIRGILITGFPAWFLWRTYYLARLPGVDRRLRVSFEWALNLIFARDIAELRVYARHPDPDASLAGKLTLRPAQGDLRV